jgi:bifunctional ADP-heptose synthase (sugar kinase/adenylyltransferase)
MITDAELIQHANIYAKHRWQVAREGDSIAACAAIMRKHGCDWDQAAHREAKARARAEIGRLREGK